MAGLHSLSHGPLGRKVRGTVPTRPGKAVPLPEKRKTRGRTCIRLNGGGGVLRTSHVGEPVVTSYTACYRHAEIRPQMAVSAAGCKDEGDRPARIAPG